MSDIITAAVQALADKLAGNSFDGSAKFEIEDHGSIVIDAAGVRASDEDTEVTLKASAETFQSILAGDLNPTTAFMTGRLKLDGDMPTETAPFLSDLLHADIDAAGVWLTCRDQVRIRVSLLRAEHARGTCIIFPGRTEYIEKYATVMQILQSHGLNVVTVDWRGQGLADRLLADRTVGHIGTFDDYQRDVDAVMEW